MSLVIRTTGWDDYMDPSGGSWVKALILGVPDVGKTRSASFWPKPIFADCEDGRMSLADRGVPYGRIRSTADMDALIEQLKFDAKRPPDKRKYLTFVLDTIDHYQKIAIHERLRKEKKEALSGWADWGWLDGHMQQFVEKLLNLEMNIIVNCHYKTVVETDDDDAKAKNVYQTLRLKGDVKEWLLEEFDLIGMMESTYKAEKGDRVRKRHIRWHNEPSFPLLKDRSGSLPQFTEVDFTDNDYTRVFDALMSKVDSLPAGTDVEEIEVAEEVPAAGTDEKGGPVEVGKLPEKKVTPAKKTVAKKVAKKVAAAEPGEAVTTVGKGTKENPLVVDANKVNLENVDHAHAPTGECLKNKFGTCGTEEPSGEAEQPGTPASPETATETGASAETPEESATDVPNDDSVGSGTSAAEKPLTERQKHLRNLYQAGPPSDEGTDEAKKLVTEQLGGEVISEEKRETPVTRPEKYCGLQPASHTKFPAVEGCEKDLAGEIPAKVNLALLRAKTLLCPSCFDAWKAQAS